MNDDDLRAFNAHISGQPLWQMKKSLQTFMQQIEAAREPRVDHRRPGYHIAKQEWMKENNVQRTESQKLQDQLDALTRQLADISAKLENTRTIEQLFPTDEEPFAEGTVIRFERNGYTFVALHVGGGTHPADSRWYVTGGEGNNTYTWFNLRRAMITWGVRDLVVVTQWTPIAEYLDAQRQAADNDTTIASQASDA